MSTPSVASALYTARPRRWVGWFPAALAALVLLMAALLDEASLRLVGQRPWDPLRGRLPEIVEPGGTLYQADPQLGFVLLPGRYTVKQRLVTWTATHVDKWHRAARPNHVQAPPPGSRDAVWIFGDSNSYGWGNNDDQVYAWLLQQRHPELEIVNFAMGGYSNVQSMIQLEQALAAGTPAPRLAILAYASYHDGRNAFLRANRKNWYPYISRYPYFPAAWFERSQLKYGMVKLEYTPWPLMKYSALINFLEEKYNKSVVLTS